MNPQKFLKTHNILMTVCFILFVLLSQELKNSGNCAMKTSKVAAKITFFYNLSKQNNKSLKEFKVSTYLQRPKSKTYDVFS